MPKNALSTILVVDDNLGARRSIEALLTQANYRFLMADSGAFALQILEEHTPDIILLDVMMPGMNGFEVCQKIRATPRISEIPIIMITALDDEDSMIQGIDAGADDFLSKPISKIELRSRIASILRLNRFRKLCNERQKYELVVAQSHRGYVVTDQNHRILSSNTAAKKMLQIGAIADETGNFFEIARRSFTLQPNDIEQALSQPNEAQETAPFLLVQSAQGKQNARWIRVTFQDLGLDQSSQRFLRLEDITDRIVSFQEKHTFSRMISHKLLTPLNAIKAAHQLLDAANSNPERIPQIQKIQKKGIERLEYDIHSILSFLESGRTSHRTLSILNAQANIERLAASSPFRFSLTPQHRFQPNETINISEHGFDACLREIVQNAIKFHRDEQVSINCYIRQTEDRSEVQFIFQNNSYPLSEDELSNAWKPYWQADRYVTGEIPGMGLGLSLIAANVWTAGGACKIENDAQSNGVQLTLTFPVTQH